MISTVIDQSLGLEFPIFQGGMAWVADALFNYNIAYFLCKRTHKHDVYAENFIGHCFALSDFLTELFAVGIHSCNNAETACV